jgi:hypothetical protein
MRRGSNSFRYNDGLRALRIARDDSMEPSELEVFVGKGGAGTFPTYGEKAVGLMPLAPESAAEARVWPDEIAKLKGKLPRAQQARHE